MNNQVMTVPPWDIEDPDITPWEASAYQAGAAVAFGLMGMATAIRFCHPWCLDWPDDPTVDMACPSCKAPERKVCLPGCTFSEA